MGDKLRAAILGATGLVGQVFVKLLSEHPLFEISYLAASEKRVGKRYGDEVRWVLNSDIPEQVRDLVLDSLDPDKIKNAGIDVVFSALPSNVAGSIEIELAKKGLTVVSNASPLRLEPDVPLVIPEINWEHMKLLEVQRRRRGWNGAIVKNSNCTTAILVLSLKPLMDLAGLDEIYVATMQAVSGAGYSGVPSVVIIDNIIPFIEKEEAKIVNESKKILGRLAGDHVVPADFKIYATTTRVPVIHGHLEVVYTRLRREVEIEEVVKAWLQFRGVPQEVGAWLAPQQPIIVRQELDRPQPRLDRDAGLGMAVSVGRFEMLENRLLRYIVLGHNLIRGAAGNTILIAELMAREGLL
ncbi:MAG TPA: aspartate-semialdehyde dehydrogenase [Pyrodictium sp.]|nr:aspartate-semialdehyde dehydrogenase [Pyrodictium sp.]